MANIGAEAHVLRGFDLHAQEMAMMLDGKVEARGISIRLGDTQSVRGGSRHETHLRPLAPLLAVFDIYSSVCHVVISWETLVVSGCGQ
jgi:hypothetical protein